MRPRSASVLAARSSGSVNRATLDVSPSPSRRPLGSGRDAPNRSQSSPTSQVPQPAMQVTGELRRSGVRIIVRGRRADEQAVVLHRRLGLGRRSDDRAESRASAGLGDGWGDDGSAGRCRGSGMECCRQESSRQGRQNGECCTPYAVGSPPLHRVVLSFLFHSAQPSTRRQ
jgi:hypothetical protein